MQNQTDKIEHPPILPRIERRVLDGETVWIKRPEQSRSNGFVWVHKLLKLLLPQALHPTNAMGGIQALHEEAARLNAFAEHSIPVPKVIETSDQHIVLSDTGAQLRNTLNKVKSETERKRLLMKAVETLQSAHSAGFAHGRPHIKDMTIDTAELIYLLDLEEDPLKIMPSADAQARDIWLFLSSIAEFFEDKPTAISEFLNAFLAKADQQTTDSLATLGQKLKPYRRIIGGLRATNISRDVTGAYFATLAIEGLSKAPKP